MQTRSIQSVAALLAGMALAGGAFAADITGEAIFSKENPRVAKVEQALAAANAAADAEFKQAQIRHLRAKLRACARAVDILAAEEAAARRENDTAGLAALAGKKNTLAGQLAACRQALDAEVGASEEEAPGGNKPVPAAGNGALPQKEPAIAPAAGVSAGASVLAPAAVPEEAPAAAIVPEDVPKLMLGKWVRKENGKVCGYYLLANTGQMKTYKGFRANGSPDPLGGGTWRVTNTGEVVLSPDIDNSRDTLHIMLADPRQGAGAHWVRTNESAPYREGGKVEWLREGK